MADNKKTYRINKVATEFNVSWKTIVEHLNEKGFEVESKITAKLDDAMYQDLLGFYQKDKQAKEESQQLEINIRKDVKTKEIKEVKKVTPPTPEFTPEPTIFIKDTSSKPKSHKEATPVVETPKAETPKVEKANPVVETPKVETPKAEETKPVMETPKVEAPKVEDAKPGTLKVLGKVSLNTKKPTKKVETPKLEKPKVETKAPATPTEEPKKEIETEYKKLEGTKVLGKVEIKKPVKKTRTRDKPGDEPKKKRKRIRGEKVT
ncbi:hypothetical protein OAD66_09950, partial [Bacteroidia bacterium]|nr:hypothetical protein [Bacteroidia bacterium]